MPFKCKQCKTIFPSMSALNRHGSQCRETELLESFNSMDFSQPVSDTSNKDLGSQSSKSNGGLDSDVDSDSDSDDPCDMADNVPSSQAVIEVREGLIHIEDLDAYGVAINPIYNLYICTSCNSALTCNSYQNHLKEKHGMKVTGEMRRIINAVSKEHNIQDKYPKIDTCGGPIPFIAGLEIQHKHGCPVPGCMYTAAKSRIQQHIRTEHEAADLVPLENIPCQVFNSGAAPTNIRIVPPKQSTGSAQHSLYSDFESYDVNDSVTMSAPDDKRLISPWLLRTGFHKYVEGKDISELIKICAMPIQAEENLVSLQALVEEYLRAATKLVDNTDPLVLQLLNSEDLQKNGINHTPFREQQEHDTTIKDYSVIITRLLATLLRDNSDEITLPSSQSLNDALLDFTTEQTIETMHYVFKALWLNTWPAIAESNFSDPSICFLAIFTLEKDGHFKHPKAVTKPIAQLCRAIRLTTLTEIHRLVASQTATSTLEAFESLSWAVREGNMSTFHKLRFYQHYASAIAYQTISLPKIVWPFREEGRFDVMLYLGQLVSLQQLLNIIQDLESEAKEIWEKRILRGAILELKRGVLADNLRDTSQGYSFLQDKGNGFTHRRHELGRHLLQSVFLQNIPGSTQKSLNMAEVRVWLTDLARLEAILLLLVEMKSGAPIRLAELCSTLAHNTEFRTRNLMALGTRIVLIRQYTKTTHNKQMDGLIPSLMAAFEADMNLHVHIFAWPVAQWASHQLFPEDQTVARMYQDMLFMDFLKPFSADSASVLLGQKSAPHLNWKLRILGYRQMIIGFRNKNKIDGVETDIQEDMMRVIYAQQSGHSVSTENRTYGLSPDLVEGLADATIEVYLQSSLDWQGLLKVVPGNVALPYHQSLVRNRTQLEAEGVIRPTTARQQQGPQADMSEFASILLQIKTQSEASHRILMAEIADLRSKVQALQGNNIQLPPPPASTPLATNSSPPAILSPPPPTQPPLSKSSVNALKRSRSDSHSNADIPPPKRMNVVKRAVDMVDCLSRFVGKEVTWRNTDQKAAVSSLLALKRDLIIVLRTGLGKTAIALLPPMVESGVTVVVVPLVILLEEWKARLQGTGIPYDVFLHDRKTHINPAARVVLVSSDTARFQSWKEKIAKLHDIRPVVRMVIDEAHYYFTDTDFRSNAMGNPFALRILPWQIVLLSATIPPAAEQHLKERFGLHLPYTIRGLSHRKELKYRILEGEPDTEAMVAQFIKYRDGLKLEQQWNRDARWIVFVPWVGDGYRVAQLLGVEFYHAGSDEFPMSREERTAVYNRFISGHHKGLVATTALGAGTDYPHIRLTCHLGAMYGMVNFVQQSSRAGRDDEPAHCIVIPDKKAPKIPNASIADLTGVKEMHELVYIRTHNNPQKICIRRQIGKKMDGVSYCCFDFDPSYQLCGICEQVIGVEPDYFTEDAIARMDPPASLSSFPVPPLKDLSTLRKELWDTFGEAVGTSSARTAVIMEEKADQLHRYKRVLDVVGKNCGVCWTKGTVVEHTSDDCPYIIPTKRDYWAFKKTIHYRTKGYKYSPCWKCHICSMGNDYLHKDYIRGSTSNCKTPNLLPGLLYHLWVDPLLRAKVEAHIGKKWSDISDWAEWLGEKTEEHSTHSMELVAWFGEEYLSAS